MVLIGGTQTGAFAQAAQADQERRKLDLAHRQLQEQQAQNDFAQKIAIGKLIAQAAGTVMTGGAGLMAVAASAAADRAKNALDQQGLQQDASQFDQTQAFKQQELTAEQAQQGITNDFNDRSLEAKIRIAEMNNRGGGGFNQIMGPPSDYSEAPPEATSTNPPDASSQVPNTPFFTNAAGQLAGVPIYQLGNMVNQLNNQGAPFVPPDSRDALNAGLNTLADRSGISSYQNALAQQGQGIPFEKQITNAATVAGVTPPLDQNPQYVQAKNKSSFFGSALDELGGGLTGIAGISLDLLSGGKYGRGLEAISRRLSGTRRNAGSQVGNLERQQTVQQLQWLLDHGQIDQQQFDQAGSRLGVGTASAPPELIQSMLNAFHPGGPQVQPQGAPGISPDKLTLLKQLLQNGLMSPEDYAREVSKLGGG